MTAEHHNDFEDEDIVSTRMFDAPRKAVFEAFSDPHQLATWWGPSGFSNTIKEFDLRPSGFWRLTMHSPNGVDFQNVSQFLEIVAPARIVYDHLEPIHRFLMTMTFDDIAGRTRLTWRMRFESADEAAKLREFVLAANEQNFDRLAEHLKSTVEA